MNIAVYVVFIVTYLLIASRRLALLPIGRPAGALVGAVLMVVIGALTPEESYFAIDHHTIILLFGTMVITIYLELNGFFAGFHLGYTALAGVMILILAENKDPRHVFAKVDWSFWSG